MGSWLGLIRNRRHAAVLARAMDHKAPRARNRIACAQLLSLLVGGTGADRFGDYLRRDLFAASFIHD